MAESRSPRRARSRRSEQEDGRKKQHEAPSTSRRTPRSPLSPVLPTASSPVSSRASTRSRSPPARHITRRTRRSESSSTSDDPSAPGSVYLLDERAAGRAGAGIKSNQLTFMKLFGLVDGGAQDHECDENEWTCPLPESTAELLAIAADHRFFEQLYQPQATDGLVLLARANEWFGVQDKSYMCSCVAHQALQRMEVTNPLLDSLKDIIRSPEVLDVVTGYAYAVALLKYLFYSMGLPQFRATETRRIEEVSYSLLKNDKKYSFRGVPDYMVVKSAAGADQILVATGEVQSTNLPAVQNSIYGIGKLLETVPYGRTPVLCITLLKTKMAVLSMARWGEGGSVSLKFVVSHLPIDLTTPAGIQLFAARLYNCLV